MGIEDASDDELAAEYNRRFHPHCYLCKRPLPGGIAEVMDSDEAIGFDPALQHVNEMLEGIIPTNYDERFGQSEKTEDRMGDAIVCMDCLNKIKEGHEGAPD